MRNLTHRAASSAASKHPTVAPRVTVPELGVAAELTRQVGRSGFVGIRLRPRALDATITAAAERDTRPIVFMLEHDAGPLELNPKLRELRRAPRRRRLSSPRNVRSRVLWGAHSSRMETRAYRVSQREEGQAATDLRRAVRERWCPDVATGPASSSRLHSTDTANARSFSPTAEPSDAFTSRGDPAASRTSFEEGDRPLCGTPVHHDISRREHVLGARLRFVMLRSLQRPIVIEVSGIAWTSNDSSEPSSSGLPS